MNKFYLYCYLQYRSKVLSRQSLEAWSWNSTRALILEIFENWGSSQVSRCLRSFKKLSLAFKNFEDTMLSSTQITEISQLVIGEKWFYYCWLNWSSYYSFVFPQLPWFSRCMWNCHSSGMEGGQQRIPKSNVSKFGGL